MSNAPSFRRDATREIAEQAFDLMQQYAVTPTPMNYEIWYTYAAESSPHLKAAIDTWIDSGAPFSGAIATDIHKRFLAQGPSTHVFQEIGERIGVELERITSSLEQAGRDTTSYGHALRGAAGLLGGTDDFSAIRTVIDNLILATRHMDQRSRTLEVKLQESTSEVRLLREDIEAIRHQALTDQLTGLANRKAFDDHLTMAAMEARQDGSVLSLLMGDIDFFKSFNDTWGHQTGDQVLRLVARCLTENIKGRDTAARYGGEEFAVILPHTTIDDAVKLADQIRRTVQTKKVVKRSTGATLGTITMSLGAAMLRDGEATATLIERADAALYAAKHAGRNCVRSERDPEVLPLLVQTLSEPQPRASSAA